MIMHGFGPQDSPADTVGDLETRPVAGSFFGSLPCSFFRQMDVDNVWDVESAQAPSAIRSASGMKITEDLTIISLFS